MPTPKVELKITARDDTRAAIQSVQRNLRSISDRLATLHSLTATVGAAFATFRFAVAPLVNFGRAAIDAADRIDELSQRTGLSAEQLLALGHAAKLSGTLRHRSGQCHQGHPHLSDTAGALRLSGVHVWAVLLDQDRASVYRYPSLEEECTAVDRRHQCGNDPPHDVLRLSTTLLQAARGGKEAQEIIGAFGISVRDDLDTALLKLSDRFRELPAGPLKTALAVRVLARISHR